MLACDVFIRNNIFRFISSLSSLIPNGNDVRVMSYNNSFIKDVSNAVLYYRLDTSVYPAIPIKKESKNVADLNLQSDDYIIK